VYPVYAIEAWDKNGDHYSENLSFLV